MKIVAPSIFKRIDSKSTYLPSYLFEEYVLDISSLQYFLVRVSLFFLKMLVRFRLKAIAIVSRTYKGGFLSQEVVNQIYTREAKNYEWKHHLTTNFRDTWWRRIVAFHIVSLIGEKPSKKIKILDVGTGIGLSIEEMFRVFKDFDLQIEAIGLDYNISMLEQAHKVVLPRMKNEGLLEGGRREVSFIRGDARNLRGAHHKEEGFSYFRENEFDFITLICGAGGIHLPIEAFREQLGILKNGGYLIMVDIHRPLLHTQEHWPWYLKFLHRDLLQYMGWKKITIPLVLRDLWGWMDPTPLFYTAPFTIDSRSSASFDKIDFTVKTEKWWFGLPVMTTAELILEKRDYSREEIERKSKIQQELNLSLIKQE